MGIDYSGAEAPYSTLEGFRVYLAEGDGPANEVLPLRIFANSGHDARLPSGWLRCCRTAQRNSICPVPANPLRMRGMA